MLVLGVDPGSSVTGYGLVENISGQLNYCHDVQLKLPSKATVGEKLALLYDYTTELLLKYKPDQLAVEGIFYGSNVKSIHQSHSLQQCLQLFLPACFLLIQDRKLIPLVPKYYS